MTLNYFIGPDPAGWRTNIPTFKGVVYQQLYPGVDLGYDTIDGQMKGTYIVAPGANPAHIRWRYEGPTQLQINSTTGDLQATLPQVGTELLTATNTLTEQAPISWQELNGERQMVATSYRLAPDGSVGFELASYDVSQPLVIDPTITYSTAFGGSENDEARDITLNSAGEVFVVGSASSADYPQLQSGLISSLGATNAFLTKLSSDGKTRLYSVFIGGLGTERDLDLAVEAGARSMRRC